MSDILVRNRLTRFLASRREVIQKLKELRDEIQEEERRRRIGNIAYSSTGVVAGGLTIAGLALIPFTFGASLGLTIAGAAIGAASGIAGISHGIAAHVIIKNKSEEAERLLKEHKNEMESLESLINQTYFVISTSLQSASLVKTITNMSMKSATMQAFRTSRAVDAVESVATTVATTSSKVFTIAGGVIAGISIVIEIGSIFN
ncbi:apolipoprotein L3-like [Saccostrea cucullata]|uniref:apolipoprotein L3-like n=1 Tax=Saccostrea cuccullata TaxID=36930 RepID=UPI002ED0EC8F